MVLELARPSEARCFPPAGDFFEVVLVQQPQATEAVEKGCFSRILDDTLGTFSAPFRGFSALHCHGVWGWRVQCFRGLEGVSFELLSISSFFRAIELLSSFFRASFLGFQTTRLAVFWCGFGTSSSFRGMVFPPGGWFFRSCFTAAAAGNRSCRKMLFF